MRFVILKLIILTSIVTCLAFGAEAKNDSLIYKNSFKLDFMSIYNTLFDRREQIREGFEFERKINNKSFMAYHLDIGVYDKYVFRKYYDFFSQYNGMYYIEKNVVTKGFHFIPGYYYYIKQSKRIANRGLFVGVNADFNFYRKKIKSFNSQTDENVTNKYNQSKLAIGLTLGCKYNIYRRFFAELQTSMFASVFKQLSDKDMNPVRPLIAQWNDPKYNYWWMSEIKLCYAF